MTPGSGRHRAIDDPDDPTATIAAVPAQPSSPPFAGLQYGPPPPFVAASAASPHQPPPPFQPPSQHPPLLELAFQRDSEPTFEDEPPFEPAPAPQVVQVVQVVPEPQFIPLRRPRRSRRNLGRTAAAGLALAVVLGGGYAFMTRSNPDSGAQAAPPITIRLPSATASLSPVAKSKATAVRRPVKYRSTKGHFTVHFAHQPSADAHTTTVGGRRITTYRVIDAKGNALVEATDFPYLAPSHYDPVLAGGISGIRRAVASTSAVTSTATTFRHHPARRFALRAPNGTSLTGIVTIFPGTRFYVLMAPTGASFLALEKSFGTLP